MHIFVRTVLWCLIGWKKKISYKKVYMRWHAICHTQIRIMRCVAGVAASDSPLCQVLPTGIKTFQGERNCRIPYSTML